MAEPTSAADNQILKPHSNAIVPHKIANHDTEAVQLNVWNGTEWVNIYDGNDMRNMNIDLHKVSKVVEKHAAEIPAVESAANSAVEQAESAVSASKVNSEAIAAQSEAVSEAKSAMDSANADIQQLKDNVASDIAKINADVAQVQSEIDANKAANSASVEALKSDVSAAKQDLADVHDRLDQAQSAIEQNQKLINDSVAKITSDVSSTKQDLANVHDSLAKAQAAAEANQKAINQSIAQINSDVDGTKQDLAGVRKNLTKAQADITANQKSINDNVAQINADIAQDRKDIASAQQANADTAKQLDTYSKQATEQSKTIKAIQDKQDGFTATLADMQGNVSQVSDKVSGLSANLKGAQDNVASVKAQADQLSATLTDHAKSIATLTASAKELSSTLEDADGRLNKVEQTAQTNSSTLSDVQGNLSQVKQQADGLVSTLKDAQGNISTLQQKTDSVSAQLATAQGDIATLQTGVDSVKATLTSHDKSIHTLQADSKSLKDSMVNAQGDISTLRKTATDVTSELEDHTGRLSKVEQSAAKQATTLSDLQGNLSQVEQKADSNTATISSINKNAMQDRGVITDTKTSFDSLTQLGTYSIKASGLPMMPEQHYGTLVVSGSAGSGWLSQQFVADTTENVYTRVFSNNAWSAWKQGGSQDAINQVKQTADSNSATIRNVQGDVNTLKQTATGVEAALADHEGDIHTLQADSKSLTDDITDAQGNISKLQKTSTDLTSEMQDHDGRLSKVEQTAKEHTTTISDLGDKLNNMQIGGRNLLTNTDKDVSVTSHTTDGWPAWANIDTGFSFEHGKTYTFSAEAKNSTNKIAEASIRVFEGSTNTQVGIYAFPADGKRHSVTFTIPNDSHDYHLLLYAGHAGIVPGVDVTTTYHHPKLEFGNVATDWTPAPEDLATVTQVKQTADGIETTLKSAQGDIDQIKQTAKGTSEQLADVQGNVTNIQKDVTGLKQTTADNAGNIHTLQADSKTLKDDMQDAQGDISTLKKTSTDVTAELQDHAGRISKTEQTASTLVNELADQQGHLNRVEQTAQGTQQTVANQQGQINTIKTDAAGIHQALTGQGNQIANINVTLSGLNTKYEGVSGDLNNLKSQAQWATVTSAVDLNNVKTPCHEFLKGTVTNAPNEAAWWYLTVEGSESGRITQTVIADQSNNRYTRRWADSWSAWVRDATQTDITALSNRITTNSTQITQNKKEIDLKADQSTVDNLSGEVSQNKAQLKVQAGQISSKVSSEDFSALNDRAMQNRGTVSAPDFNSLMQAGYYTVTMPYNGKNYPTVNWGTLEVSGQASDANGRLNQKYVSDNNVETYVRQYNANTKSWTAWIKAANQNDINTLDGKISKNSTAIDQTNKQISLKADQTEVDTIKGTASQNSSRLDVMADQIKSKVASTDVNNIVDGKGYATMSYTQTLVNQTKSQWDVTATNLTDRFNSLQVSIDGLQSTVKDKADQSQITQLSNLVQTKVSQSDFNRLNNQVNVQTLDSANIDNMKTTGHYFVHNLAGNPIPGWVYVDVAGNANDRIRQDVYQDNGAKHAFRRWFGSYWTEWFTGVEESEITQLRSDINLRVKSGDLISQINLAAGNTLIQSGKIYLDAQSVVFGKDSKAFIPAALITNLTADQITTGTLKSIQIDNGDGKFTVNSSGDVVANSIKIREGNIYQGDIIGANFYAITNTENKRLTQPINSLDNVDDANNNWFKINGNILEWHHVPDEYASIGPGLAYMKYGFNQPPDSNNQTQGLTITDTKCVTLSTGHQAHYQDDPKDHIYTKPIKNNWNMGWADETRLEVQSDKVQVTLSNDGGPVPGAQFSIQKDDRIGAYFGRGDHGNVIQLVTAGDGGNVDVNSSLTVHGSKNAVVPTSQGTVAINAYETAEYYFGDIGEDQTNGDGKVWVSIDYLFGQTVNTSVPYQVFVTPYFSAHVWVSKRLKNRFLVESDKPSASFAWEIKAKRKGYEHTRLKNVDNMMEKPAGVK